MGDKEMQPEVEIRYALYNEDSGRYYGYENDDSVSTTGGATEDVAAAFKWGDPQKAAVHAFRRHPDHTVVAVEITRHHATETPVLLTTEEAANTGTGVLRFVVGWVFGGGTTLFQRPDGTHTLHCSEAKVYTNHAEAALQAKTTRDQVFYVRMDTIPGHTEYKAYHLGPDYDRPISAPTDDEEEE